MKNSKILLLTFMLLAVFSGRCLFAENLDNEDIISLIKSGIKPDLVKQKILNSDNMFDVTAAAMVELRNSGVPDDVIEVMLREAEKTESEKITRINVHIQSLASSRKEVRQTAYLSLLKMANVSRNRMLEVLTETRDPKVKAALVAAMGKMGIKDSIPYLKVMTDDMDAQVRSNVGDSLYQLLEKDAARKIADKGMLTWRAAGGAAAEAYIRIAGHLGDKKDQEFMLKVLAESPDATEREAAAWALANIYDGNVKLRELLERTMVVDSSKEVRSQAAQTLGIIGDDKSIDAFGKALRKHSVNRSELMQILGTFDNKTVIPILITCFGIEDLTIEQESTLVDVLRRITHEDFGNKMAKWLSWWEKNELRLAQDELEKSNSDPEKFRELIKNK